VGWGFGEGDVVGVEVDFKRKILGFTRDDKYYEMRIDVSQGAINPYVVLHSKWDCITIINE
jgi:hypothetical protein